VAARTCWAGTAAAEVFDIADANSLPGGWIGYAVATSAQGGITGVSDLTGLSQAVTVGASRRIKITVRVILSTTVVGTAWLKIREGSTTLGTSRVALETTGGAGQMGVIAMWVGTPSSGAHTYKATVDVISGGGTWTSAVDVSPENDAFILIEDIGPSS